MEPQSYSELDCAIDFDYDFIGSLVPDKVEPESFLLESQIPVQDPYADRSLDIDIAASEHSSSIDYDELDMLSSLYDEESRSSTMILQDPPLTQYSPFAQGTMLADNSQDTFMVRADQFEACKSQPKKKHVRSKKG